ncbi:MAG: hypothetical protein KBC96_06965 [Armatimonadetes bacterium]|nr:hypothetical protein [Armatimonadota bacterium]
MTGILTYSSVHPRKSAILRERLTQALKQDILKLRSRAIGAPWNQEQ